MAQDFREIPYNYTSANDRRVVRILLGDDVWEAVERLRDQRVTGRSAKHLMRFIGDMFLIRRNPFVYEEMVDSRVRRRSFLKKLRQELDTFESYMDNNPDGALILKRCRAALADISREFSHIPIQRARIRLALDAVVGSGSVVFDPFSVVSHATDATDWRLYLPLCVAFPSTESEIAPLLAVIGRLGLKAIPRGAGTGLTGGAVPVAPDCVMVNTEKLNHIRGIQQIEDVGPDGAPRLVEVLEVESGVVTETAIQYAEAHHRVFATDPTSSWACTIGGNIAENAGGKKAVLWGTAIDNIYSFKIAMPTGVDWEVRRVGHPLRKIRPEDAVVYQVMDSSGDEVRRITLAGSEVRKPGLWKDITNKALGGVPGLQKEGTDGVITSAKFVLHAAYEHTSTLCLEFFGEDMQEASRVILALTGKMTDKGQETLMALEHFDEEYVSAIRYRTKCDRGGRPKAVLLVDMVAHTTAQMERGLATIHDVVAQYRNTCVFVARDEAEAKRFWNDRKKFGAIARRTNAFKLNEDIVLPVEALAEFAGYIDRKNLVEKKRNHNELIARLRECVSKASPDVDGDWLDKKVPIALEFLTRAEAEVQTATKVELRDHGIVDRVLKDLSGLFAGYADRVDRIKTVTDEVLSRVIVLATHMHAGDGNVHVNIPVFSNDREMMLRAAETADEVMEKVVELGGVVSGEHGIGITKLRHLEPERLQALAEHRLAVDPDGIMNPGKLADLDVPARVFTPSFNLLELEARILKHDSLEVLADKVARCVRCGRCKPDCGTFHPARQMFYHPRNKNLAIGGVIEAILYEAQRFHSMRFEPLKYLGDVADHCTLCHKCQAPCPVDIDTAEVSLLEREILRNRRYKHTALSVRMTLFYLLSKSRVFNAVFRRVVLSWGTKIQRLASRLMKLVPDLRGFKARRPWALLKSPVPAPDSLPLHRYLPPVQSGQVLRIPPPGEIKSTVFYFPGCGSERLHSDVGLAAIYVMLRSGTQVVLAPPNLCCGFPHMANARDQQEGRQVLQDTIIFTQVREMLRYLDFDGVTVTCGTCKEALGKMGVDGIFDAPLVDAAKYSLPKLPDMLKGAGEKLLYHRPCHDSLDGSAAEVLGMHAGIELTAVPHCCSEAGTLSLSRPDITDAMLDRKATAIGEATQCHHGRQPILTNCPSCLQGLGRNAHLGVEPTHVVEYLAERLGGPKWREELAKWTENAERITF